MAASDAAPKPPAADTARIALVGNPNSGKTALFNALTGSRQKVANYAGVTVERKEGVLTTPAGRQMRVLDLPGTYSLRARSPDEAVTRDAVLGKLAGEVAPEALICVADATNLRLVLRLVLELKQVGRPFVLALNMFDIAQRQGLRIDLERLSQELGAPIVTTVATRKRGLPELLDKVEALVAERRIETENVWREPTAGEIRAAHAEAQRIFKACVKPPERPDTVTGKIDGVLLHPVAGLVILLTLLFVMFQAVFTWATPLMDGIDAGFAALVAFTNTHLPQGLLTSFIADGLIAGVGSVLVFLPQILILFFFILILEDSGYMARAAFLMDKIMGGAGLHGRAFIPLLSSFACAIPGIMSTRVIDNREDRLTTILVAPLMTCSARIPVYTLIIGAFIPQQTVGGFLSLQGLVMFGLYASGIVSALLVSFVIRRIFWRGAVEPFMMELPTYRWPEPRNLLMNLWTRARIFLARAGRIILPLMVLVWVLSTFPYPPEGATRPAIDYSIAGRLGQFLAPLMAPIGFNWQMTVALIPGMAAREVAVAVLGTVYAVGGGGGDGETGALSTLLKHQWSLASALSFLAWYVFAPQCLPTLGVVKRETNSWVWPTVMFLYMISLAYLAAFAVYHTAVAFGLG
ncbi:ferrous iron transport protein B [Caulobacter sp. RL271]|uniref:Ferrous iron transport protein B n=1 Tax=Caulobacter segnis TaxID=88688 RepID=A0ABY5A0J3_9CAUL|nr:ferrous iron transport protein B [Caulobacter segnis]USQ98493.1 ferrous iron transport protein B [Caulobacter segnis]